jgi:hypothetical protein
MMIDDRHRVWSARIYARPNHFGHCVSLEIHVAPACVVLEACADARACDDMLYFGTALWERASVCAGGQPLPNRASSFPRASMGSPQDLTW